MGESNSANNPDAPLLGAFTLLIKTSNPLENLEVLWDNGYVLDLFISSGAIKVKVGATYYSLVSVLPDREYIVQVYWSHVNTGSLDYDTQYWCRVWDFVTETWATGSTAVIDWTAPPSFESTRKIFSISTAQSHLKSDISNFCVSKSTEATRDSVVEYFKQKYSGSATVPSVDPNGKDAEYNVVLNIQLN